MRSKAIELSRNPNSKTARAYLEIASQIPDNAKGTDLVVAGYEIYRGGTDTNLQGNRPISGAVFEYLVIDALYRHGIAPIYYQAELSNIPDVKYDIFLYHPRYPVAISCKTSLGERWKQADLEGGALKQVYRGARSYLVSMPRRGRVLEGDDVQNKIDAKSAAGLDKSIVIMRGRNDFDRLLNDLATTHASQNYRLAEKVMPLVGRAIL